MFGDNNNSTSNSALSGKDSIEQVGSKTLFSGQKLVNKFNQKTLKKGLKSLFTSTKSPILVTFGSGIVIAMLIILLISIFPMSLLGKNNSELKDMTTLIQEDLNDAYIQATGLTSTAFMENIENKFGCSTENNYYRQFWEVDENSLNSSTLQYTKQEGTNVWLFQKPPYDSTGQTNACYIIIKYTPSLSEMQGSEDQATLTDIIYSYALAVNSVLNVYTPTGNSGELGTIRPTVSSLNSLKSVQKGERTNWSGFVNYETALYSWTSNSRMNDANSQQISEYEEFYSRPGYTDQATGLTIQVDMTGVTSTIEGTNYGTAGKSQCGVTHSFKRIDNTSSSALTYESSCFNDEIYKKIVELAVDNGFILRYPPGKESYTGHIAQYWTFRYVGKDVAKACYNNGDWISLEEYELSQGMIDSSDIGTFSNESRISLSTLGRNGTYTAGSDGGKDVTSSMGTDLDLVNAKRYVSKDYVPSNLVLCDDSVALRQNACDAYLAWQKAVATYSGGDTNTDDEAEQLANEQTALDEFDGNAIATTTNNDGTESIDFSSSAKKIFEKTSNSTTDATSEETRNYIKKWANSYFVTDANYPQYWEVSAKKGLAYLDLPDNESCPDGYYMASDYTQRDEQTGQEKHYCVSNTSTSDTRSTIKTKNIVPYLNANKSTAKIHVYYDLSEYRSSEIESAINNMVGQGRCDFTTDDSSNSCTEAEAKSVFWNAVASYYNSTISLYSDCDTDKDSETYGLCDPSENHVFYDNLLNGNPTNTPNYLSFASSGTAGGTFYGTYDANTTFRTNTNTYSSFYQDMSARGYSLAGGTIQCVDMARYRFEEVYGVREYSMGNGVDVANNLISKYPNLFSAGLNSDIVAGSFISMRSDGYGSASSYGHIVYVEKVSDDGQTMWITEGLPYIGVVINREVNIASYIAANNVVQIAKPN